jgi:hypothetical protein
MRFALRTLVAMVLALVLGAGAAFLAELLVVASRPWRFGLPDWPTRIDGLAFLGPRSLVAAAAGVIVAPTVAILWGVAIDRPSLRRALGVLLGGGAAATLIVAMMQSNAQAEHGPNLTLVVVGLGATLLAGLVFATSDREPLGIAAPGALRLLGAMIPLLGMLWLGRDALADARLELAPPSFPRFDAALVAAYPRRDPAVKIAGADEAIKIGDDAFEIDRDDAMRFTGEDAVAIERVPGGLLIQLRWRLAPDLARRTHARRSQYDVLLVNGKPLMAALHETLLTSGTILLIGPEPAATAAYQAMTATPAAPAATAPR